MITAGSPLKPDITANNVETIIDPLSLYLPFVQNPAFYEDFAGDPSQPTPWQPPDWDIAIHSRDINTWEYLEPMQAGHGPDCGPPPATHPVTAYEDAVFLCRNHIMTAINANGYGVIYLTPSYMIDFSAGEAIIQFDLSTLRTSKRDWVDLWITPYEDNLQLPLTEWLPDLSGEPRRAISIKMNDSNGQTNFLLSVINNFNAQNIPSNQWTGYESFLSPSAMKRDTFELRISRERIRFGMPQYNFWWYDINIPALDWTQGVVQFGHHSYTPKKDCNNCGPNTWHWDNVSMNPVEPFTIIRANRRYADSKSNAPVLLAAPAPPNSHLRFSGIGKNLEVSFDNGKTWTKALPQQQVKYEEGAFWSYWMPISTGTNQVMFRGAPWWGGNWRVKDISVWARPNREN